MKAIVYTYQGEEFQGEIGARWRNPPGFMAGWFRWETSGELDQSEIVWLDREDDTRLYLRVKDIRAVVTDLHEDVLSGGDPPSSGAAPQPSEPPEESSAPEGT